MEKPQSASEIEPAFDTTTINGPAKHVTLGGVSVGLSSVGDKYYHNLNTGTIGAFCDIPERELGAKPEIDEVRVAEAGSAAAPEPEKAIKEVAEPPTAKIVSHPSGETRGWSSGGTSIY